MLLFSFMGSQKDDLIIFSKKTTMKNYCKFMSINPCALFLCMLILAVPWIR